MTWKTETCVYFSEEKLSQYAKETGYLTYGDIISREVSNLILCNEIPSIDFSICENALFDWCDEEDNPIDIFQWYLTGCNEWDIKYIKEKYPGELLFTYSNKLDLYVLCVDHFGTAWNYVSTGIKIEKVED